MRQSLSARRFSYRYGLPGLGHFGALARGFVEIAAHQPCQVLVQRAHGRADRHVVVVEDDQQVAVFHAGIVERLEGHARRHGAVTDDGDALAHRS